MRAANYWKARGWQWRTNPSRGESYVLDTWVTRSIIKRTGQKYTLYDGWERRGLVYKAHRGDRWVYQCERTHKTQGFVDLRTALRMAVFLTLLEKRNE